MFGGNTESDDHLIDVSPKFAVRLNRSIWLMAPLADKLLANGRASTASAMGLKYTSRRLGGVGDQVGADGKTLNDGCLHILNNYYARTAPPALPQTAVAGPTHLSSSIYSHHPSVQSAYV